MNIGSLIRGLLGDSKPGESKSVDLKEGQVVRGVVLSVSDSGKEAVVQIQGTPVKAELETPLQAGQTLNLQVGAPGEGGLPTLKPVSQGEAGAGSPQSMGEALESLGLKDAKAGREIVLAMQSGGLALTKENAAKLNAVMTAKPPGVPTEQWLEAAVVSLKRGLPVTAESVRGLQQAIFGPPLHQLISALEEQLNLWAGQQGGKEGMTAGADGKTTAATPNGGTVSGPNAPVVGGNPDANGSQAGKGATAAPLTGTEGNAVGKGSEQAAGTGTAGSAGSAGNSGSTGATGNTGNPVNTGSPATSAGSSVPVQSAIPEGSSSAVSGSEEKAAAGVAVPATADGDEGQAAGAARSGIDAAAAKATAPAPTAGAALAASAANTGADGAEAQQNNAARAGGLPADSEAGKLAAGPAAERSGTALLAKLQGVLSELRGTLPQLTVVPPAGAAGQPQAPAAGTPQGMTAPPASAAGQEPAQAQPRGERAAAAATPQPGAAPAHDTESWVGRVLKLLGAEHEQQAVRGSAAAAAEARPAAVPVAAGGREAQLPQAVLGGASGAGDNGTETLKGVLLQAMSSSEVPPAVKEAAGQLIQQLTGQQLLLNTDRTAPFAQVTLFLPLHGQDGQETASVHIQSRRGRKGELDAANCRLWFDLDMKQLGQTLVDVQVVDRIVSLKMHNNHPAVLQLLEQRRDDIGTAVESIGYQLLSLKTEPLPERSSAADSAANVSKLADYVPDSYKGVDYRI